MELGNMGGVDQAGYAGFTDKVNNHYWRIFGNATLLSLISAGAQLSQPEDDNNDETTANETLAAEMGRQWSQVGQQMVRRNLNIQPTLEIRPGYQFNVMVNKDLILEPYEPMEPGR
jgi:type IV secretion system protein VirB10